MGRPLRELCLGALILVLTSSVALAQGADRTHTNFSSGAFGRITSMEGTPRIMQFGVKYGF